MARAHRRCYDPQSASPAGRSASFTIGPAKSAAGNPRRTHSLRPRAGAVGMRPVYQTLEWRPRHRGWSRTPSDGVQVCGPQRTAGLTRAVHGSQSAGLRRLQVGPKQSLQRSELQRQVQLRGQSGSVQPANGPLRISPPSELAVNSRSFGTCVHFRGSGVHWPAHSPLVSRAHLQVLGESTRFLTILKNRVGRLLCEKRNVSSGQSLNWLLPGETSDWQARRPV